MSALNLNSRERQDVHSRLLLLNGSFSYIVQLLDDLAQTSVLNARDLREMRGRAQQIQLEINTKLLPPLEAAELTDHAQFEKARVTNGEATQRQASRSNAQASPIRILLAFVAALNILLLVASLLVKPGADWVYHSQDGIPAPCPPPNRGFFPRDCH